MSFKLITLNLKTGEQMEQSLLLKKARKCFRMAGHSPPLLLLKQLMLLELELFRHFLYSNSLIARHPSETEVLMEDL
jgi:hypothetical protein